MQMHSVRLVTRYQGHPTIILTFPRYLLQEKKFPVDVVIPVTCTQICQRYMSAQDVYKAEMGPLLKYPF